MLDAKQMVTIAHRDAGFHSVSTHDHGDAFGRGPGVSRFAFGKKVTGGYASPLQVSKSDAAFREPHIIPRATCGDYEWRQATLEERVRMVQAGAKNGGWMSSVLGGSEDDDNIGGLGFIAIALPHN
jgi:hypothetical protein